MMRGPDAKRESIIMVGAKVSSQERLRSAAQPVHLQWTRVNFQVGERKILQNLNGDVQPGEVCAVMGPSGSGKTTLMDFVASRIDPSPAERILSGDVLLNHTAVRDPNTFANFGAYVPQEEALVGTLTASETLRFAARLTVGGNLRTRIDDIVEETINEMGLRVCADTVVGTVFRKGLSGGQKRRLSVAVELIRSPSLLVLDEPTSGLDSASAFALIDHLKGLGKNGHTIILSIHQPSSEIWGLFDKVGFMSAGQSVYFGPAGEKCLNYFKSIGKACPSYSNPADFIISLINADFPGRTRDDVKVLIEAYAQYEAKKETDRRTAQPERKTDEPYEHKHLQRPGFCERLTTLVHRDFLELIRDPGIIGVRLAMYSMLALMVGLMYLNLGNKKDFESVNSRISVLFYIAAFMVFMSVAVLPFFIIQRDVFLKERLNRAYNVPEYAISKFLTSLPGVFLLALLTTTLVVLQAKLNGFAIYLLTLFVSLLIAEGFMSVMAVLVPHYIIGIALAAGFYGFFMLCQGFFIVKSQIPPWFIWGYHLGFSTYSFRIFMHNEFDSIDSFDSDSFFQSGEAVLKFYSMNDVDVPTEFGILFAYVVFFQLLFAFVLWKFQTGRR